MATQKFLIFTPKLSEMIQFDGHIFSDGLKSPPANPVIFCWLIILKSFNQLIEVWEGMLYKKSPEDSDFCTILVFCLGDFFLIAGEKQKKWCVGDSCFFY